MSEESVIYCITCSANGKKYIGRTRQLQMRLNSHLTALRSNRHPNKPLQEDFNSFGEKMFSIEILPKIECNSPKQLEKGYMIQYDTWNPLHGYNDKEPAFFHCGKETKTMKSYMNLRWKGESKS